MAVVTTNRRWPSDEKICAALAERASMLLSAPGRTHLRCHWYGPADGRVQIRVRQSPDLTTGWQVAHLLVTIETTEAGNGVLS